MGVEALIQVCINKIFLFVDGFHVQKNAAIKTAAIIEKK